MTHERVCSCWLVASTPLSHDECTWVHIGLQRSEPELKGETGARKGAIGLCGAWAMAHQSGSVMVYMHAGAAQIAVIREAAARERAGESWAGM